MSVAILQAPRGKVEISGHDVRIEAAGRSSVEVARAGTQGVPGPEGSPRRFDFTDAATWIADHNLGRAPALLIYLANGERVLADYRATTSNFTVTHATPLTGFVLLI